MQHHCAVATAAHLTDHVFPRLPVRQWVLSVPKRLRFLLQRDGAALNMVLRIFLRVIAQSLQDHCAGAAQVQTTDSAALHIGAVAFIHRFGSSLNGHVKELVVPDEPAITGEGLPGVEPLGHAIPSTPEPAPPKRSKAHYLWAVLIARIYEVFPLLCPLCGGQMRLIAFITGGTRESGGFWITSVGVQA